MTSTPGPAMEFLGRVAYEITIMRPMMSTCLHLLASAIFPIYTAAHASLARPSSAAKPLKKRKSRDSSSEDEDGEVVHKIEGLTPSDALIFPLLAGATLASLYFILKWLQDPAWLNWVLGIYFSWIGLFFATKFLKDALSLVRSLLLPTQYSAHSLLWKSFTGKSDHFRAWLSSSKPAVFREDSPLPGIFRKIPLPTIVSKTIWRLRRNAYAKAQLHLHIHKVVTVKSPVDNLDVISLIFSTVIVAWHTFVSKPWFLTNFIGFSFCYGSLQLMTPTTAWTGTLLLCGLFFYDGYMVFFTPMMLTVATKLDVPVKLLFPRPDGCVLPIGAVEGSTAMEEYLQCLAKKRTMAMLGLGDIVIPGMILAFALRFDLYLFYLKQTKLNALPSSQADPKADSKPTYLPASGGWGECLWTSKKIQSPELRAKYFPKTYFNATVIGYLIGMITTVVVMQVFEHAQPALLYLVPGVLIAFWGTALIKGDLKLLWHYTEGLEEQEKKDSKDEKSSTKDEEAAEGNARVEEGSKESRSSNNADHKKDKKPAEKANSEKNCRQLFLLSITITDSTPATKVLPKEDDSASAGSQEAATQAAPAESTTGSSRNSFSIISSKISSQNSSSEEDMLPDVAADQAVLAKLRKEVSASSTGTVDEKGGEPPEKRRRKA